MAANRAAMLNIKAKNSFPKPSFKKSATCRFGFIAALAMMTSAILLTSARGDEVTKLRDTWDITIGGGAILKPSYEGGKDHIVDPLPYFDASWYDTSGHERMFISVEDGAGIDILSTGKWSAGPLLFWRPGRGVSDSGDLRGLDYVESSFQGGAFLEYDPHECCDVFLRVRHDMLSDSNGTFVDIGGEVNAPIAEKHWYAGLKVVSTWANNPGLQPMFGITPSQSSASGLAGYTPKSGVKDVEFQPSLTYQFNESWATQVFMNYERLLGPASDSPLIRDRGTPDQLSGGLLLLFHFNS
jgi:outer membrane protein